MLNAGQFLFLCWIEHVCKPYICHVCVWIFEAEQKDLKLIAYCREMVCYSVKVLILYTSRYKWGCPSSLMPVLSKQIRVVFVSLMCFYPSFVWELQCWIQSHAAALLRWQFSTSKIAASFSVYESVCTELECDYPILLVLTSSTLTSVESLGVHARRSPYLVFQVYLRAKTQILTSPTWKMWHSSTSMNYSRGRKKTYEFASGVSCCDLSSFSP